MICPVRALNAERRGINQAVGMFRRGERLPDKPVNGLAVLRLFFSNPHRVFPPIRFSVPPPRHNARAPPCGACFGAPANKKSLICPADKGRIAFVVPPFFRKRADFARFPFNLLNAENALSCGSRVSFPARCTRGFQPGPRSLSVPYTQVLFPVIAGYLLYCTAFSCSCQPFTA